MRYATLAVTAAWLALVPFPVMAPTVSGPHGLDRAGAPGPPPGDPTPRAAGHRP